MTSRISIDVGIVVTHLDQSLAFYQDRLGLSVVAEVSTSKIGKGRMVQLQHGESLIKLVELETPCPRPTTSPSGISAAFGYRYITMLVLDIDETMTELEANGVPIYIPLTRLDNGATIAMVEDPDGNIIEFVQEIIEPGDRSSQE